MGILNQKNRILDVVLTDLGRQYLAQNQLDITYYAFSDEGIDYSGSLSASVNMSMSIDDYMHQYLSLEGDRRTFNYSPVSGSRTISNDLKTFVYTVPATQQILPSLQTNISGTVVIQRKFIKENLSDLLLQNFSSHFSVNKPIDVVIKTTYDSSDRDGQFLSDQIAEQAGSVIKSYLQVANSGTTSK